MNLIYTTFKPKNENYETLIWEWLISLRTLGNYKGEIIVFDYGMSEHLTQKLINFELGGVNVIKLPTRNDFHISNFRNIDVIPHLEKYHNYSFAHFDADIWFQNDINILFEELKNIEGCYFGTEYGRSCRYRGPLERENLYHEICKKTGGFVFGGWIAGNYTPFLNKLKQMKILFESNIGWNIEEWGTDQSMISFLYDEKIDNINGIKYGASNYFCENSNGRIVIKTNQQRCLDEGKELIGVHINAFDKKLENIIDDSLYNLRFRNLYPSLWKIAP